MSFCSKSEIESCIPLPPSLNAGEDDARSVVVPWPKFINWESDQRLEPSCNYSLVHVCDKPWVVEYELTPRRVMDNGRNKQGLECNVTSQQSCAHCTKVPRAISGRISERQKYLTRSPKGSWKPLLIPTFTHFHALHQSTSVRGLEPGRRKVTSDISPTTPWCFFTIPRYHDSLSIFFGQNLLHWRRARPKDAQYFPL